MSTKDHQTVPPKPDYKSKTILTNLIVGAIAEMSPQLTHLVSAYPKTSVAVFAIGNIALRYVTKGRVIPILDKITK